MAGTATPGNSSASANTWLSGLLSGNQWNSAGSTEISIYIAGTSGNETLTHGAQSVTAQSSIGQDEIDAMNLAMEMISNVADITFTSVGSQADADIIWAGLDNADGQGALGWANFPGGAYSSTYNDYQSLVTINLEAYVGPATDPGGYDYITYIHELGHALGLAHPHDSGGGSSTFPGVSSAFNDYGDHDMNQGVYTMMSYNDGWQTAPHGASVYASLGWAGTPMALDIAALQHMYGANTTHASGNDTYTLPGANSAGTYYSSIWDTGGTDEIVGASGRANLIDLRAATLGEETGGGGFISYANAIHGGFTIANGVVIENATGGTLGDTIIGNSAANQLDGGAGGDNIDGAAGIDTLIGGAGSDTLDGGAGADSITGGASSDTLVGDAGDDTLNGGAGNDTFTFEGVFGDDTIAAAGSDAGETGNVISFGNLVTEAMISYALAGNNDDLLITVSGGSGQNTQSGTILVEGWNSAQGSGGGFGSMVWTAAGGGSVDLTQALFAGDPDPAPAPDPDPAPDPEPDPEPVADPAPAPINGGRRNDRLEGTEGGESMNAGRGHDAVIANGGDDTVAGASGNDTIYGGEGDDLISGGRNRDRLYGNEGNDTIDGDNGHDRIEGGSGDDLIRGGTFRDTLRGDTGNDTIDGGSQPDRIYGGAGDDSVDGGRHNDIVDGGTGNDVVLGDTGRDLLDGGAGDDTVEGGRHRDFLFGGDGDDVLSGGSYNDVLFGEAGNDTLDGGSGRDVFIFAGAFGDDVITALENGDRINLGDFRTLNGGRLTLDDLLFTASGNDVLIELDLDRDDVADVIDLDGDAIADEASILVENTAIGDLTSGDFIM